MKIRNILIILLLSLFALSSSNNTAAQVLSYKKAGDDSPEITIPGDKSGEKGYGVENPIFKALPPDIQEEILDEVQSVHDKCMGKGLYSKLHSCKCIASLFMDKRLEEPDKPSEFIVSEVTNSCPNKEETAGYGYTNCIDLNQHSNIKNIDRYCSCVGNELARIYALRPKASYQYITSLSASAYSACSEFRK